MRQAWWMIGVVAWGCDSPGDRAASQLPDASGATDTLIADDADATAGPEADTAEGPPPVCAQWREVRALRQEGAWTGAVASCEPGEYLAPGPDNALAHVNLYRALAGLPAVELDPDKSRDAQACALTMHANRSIAHEVPTDWACRSAAAVDAARLSNLATTAAIASVDLYMVDEDTEATLGHRRWLLSNSLGPIGIGSTSSYSCMHVILGDGRAGARWVAWPPPGQVPAQALRPASWLDTDRAGWSIQSDVIDLRRAEVTVSTDGEDPLEIETWALAEGYGSSFGLAIRPVGWRTEVGTTYQVTVTGVSEAIDYAFTPVDCR